MKKFQTAREIVNYLSEELNFQSYGIREGFGQFERIVLDRDGSSTLDEFNSGYAYHTFEWLDNNEQTVNVEIAIISEPLDEDGEFENYYIIG